MNEIIDYDSPIEIRNGRRVYSELTPFGNQLVGKIDAWLNDHPGLHSPSRVARGIKVATHEAETILSWLDSREMFVVGDGNGTWRKYAAR